jgi:hypothetical protein
VAARGGGGRRRHRRGVPFTAHAQIQLEVGTPLVAPEQISFPPGL